MNFQKNLDISEQLKSLHLQRGSIFHEQWSAENIQFQKNSNQKIHVRKFFAFLNKNISAKFITGSCLNHTVHKSS